MKIEGVHKGKGSWSFHHLGRFFDVTSLPHSELTNLCRNPILEMQSR